MTRNILLFYYFMGFFVAGSTITHVEEANKETEERRSLDCGVGYPEYCRSVLNAGREARNNLEPQHGVTPCRLDAALHNGNCPNA